jgi:hypothetical protein
MANHQEPVPWGWLLAVLLICFVQGWLLPQAAVVLGYVFFVSILFAARAVCFHGKIITAPIAASWSAAIAWTLAGTIENLWHGSLSGVAVVAVIVSMFLALVFAWAWCVTAIAIAKAFIRFISPFYIFLVLVIDSWLGLLLGGSIR